MAKELITRIKVVNMTRPIAKSIVRITEIKPVVKKQKTIKAFIKVRGKDEWIVNPKIAH